MFMVIEKIDNALFNIKRIKIITQNYLLWNKKQNTNETNKKSKRFDDIQSINTEQIHSFVVTKQCNALRNVNADSANFSKENRYIITDITDMKIQLNNNRWCCCSNKLQTFNYIIFQI